MAETEKKKSPFMPSNYVSILQLQERWMKEKQKEQEEKEQEKQRREEEEEEEEEKQRKRKEEEEEKEKLEQDDRKKYKKQGGGEKCEELPNPDTVAVRPPRRYRTPYNRRKPVGSRPKPKPEEEEEVKAVAAAEVEVNAGMVVVEAGGGEEVRDEERKADDDLKKKNNRMNRWRKKNKGKSKKVEDATEEMEPPATDMDIVEKKESIPARRNSERKGKRSEWRSKGEFAAASGMVWEAKDDPTVEIGVKTEEVEQEFGDLSVNRRRKGEGRERERLRFVRNGGSGGGGGGGGRDMASGRFSGGWERGRRTPGDGSLVWVKKEEV